MWPAKQPDNQNVPNSVPEPAEPHRDPQAPVGPRLPVSFFGTPEEKRARFGPPIDRKTLPPRLVSLGRQQRRVEGRGGRPPQIYECEGYIALRGTDTFVRMPGEGSPSPTMGRSGGETRVIDSFTVKGRGRGFGVGRAPDPNAPRTTVVQNLDVDPEALRLARAQAALSRGFEGGPTDVHTPAFDPVPW